MEVFKQLLNKHKLQILPGKGLHLYSVLRIYIQLQHFAPASQFGFLPKAEARH